MTFQYTGSDDTKGNKDGEKRESDQVTPRNT